MRWNISKFLSHFLHLLPFNHFLRSFPHENFFIPQFFRSNSFPIFHHLIPNYLHILLILVSFSSTGGCGASQLFWLWRFQLLWLFFHWASCSSSLASSLISFRYTPLLLSWSVRLILYFLAGFGSFEAYWRSYSFDSLLFVSPVSGFCSFFVVLVMF